MITTLHRTPTPRNVRALARLRKLATVAPQQRDRARKEGDISSVFASLSGAEAEPLPGRFADIKTALIRNNETRIQASWSRLLKALQTEIQHISSAGSGIIPSIDFDQIKNHSRTQSFGNGLQKRGVAIIKGVVPESVALSWKEEIKDYIKRNPHTKAFPKDKPAVYEYGSQQYLLLPSPQAPFASKT